VVLALLFWQTTLEVVLGLVGKEMPTMHDGILLCLHF